MTLSTIDDVAAAAGVSRATAYHHFGSRAGLIEALTTRTDHEAGYQRILDASRRDDSAAALCGTVVEAVGFTHRARPLFDHLRTLASVEADTRRMVDRKDAARRALIADLVQRASQGSLLHETVPPRHATALLIALTSYSSIRALLYAAASLEQAQQSMAWTATQLLSRDARPR